MDEQDLIDRCRCGDIRAFEELYHAHSARVHRHVAFLVGPDDADIDDLVQTTFVQVYRNMRHFRGDSRFTTWVHQITVNVAVSHMRRKNTALRRALMSLRAADCVEDTDPQPDAVYAQRQSVKELYRLLDRMKPKKRVAFVLHEIEGHTLEEIAAVVGASPNTVAGRLRAARLEVRRAVQRRARTEQAARSRPQAARDRL